MGLKHKGTQTMKTNRLVLRRFTPDDADAMFHNWASEPDVAKTVTWNTHESVETSKEVISMWLNEYQKEDTYQWCIEYSGEAIGGISGLEVNEELRSVAIGYCIGTKWWGLGIATEALRVVIDYLFDIGFNRIWGVHNIGNSASGRVMEKCGFQFEGIIRQGAVNFDGYIHDVKQYAIVASDREQNSMPHLHHN